MFIFFFRNNIFRTKLRCAAHAPKHQPYGLYFKKKSSFFRCAENVYFFLKLLVGMAAAP